MNYHSKCNICGREFHNKTQGLVNANLTNHMKSHAKRPNAPVPFAGEAPPAKRPYNKRTTQAEVHFCPRCGTNLRAVQVALTIK